MQSGSDIGREVMGTSLTKSDVTVAKIDYAWFSVSGYYMCLLNLRHL
jgi:hypothetical protein